MDLRTLMIAATAAALTTACAKKTPDVEAPVAAKPAAQTNAAQTSASTTEQAQRDLEAAMISLQRVHFSLDSWDLLPSSRTALEEAAKQLAKYPDVHLSIDGHADERGTVEHNLALGDRRARVVADYLVRMGIPTNRLEIISHGEEKPLVDGTDAKSLAKNRRVDFRILRGNVQFQLVDGHLVDDRGNPLAKEAHASRE
ncbi:OmpA family protein [Myxococcota bacterium]|nr:OmpA family protein [Myxococcota bacterium]